MKRILPLIFMFIGAVIGLFFAYKGLNKHWLSPCKTYSPESTIPQDYQDLIGILCRSGYTQMVGAIQIIAGLLLVVPKTRLAGAMLLTPVVVVIFTLHYFIDNRPEELVETGLPLVGLALILMHDFGARLGWKNLFK